MLRLLRLLLDDIKDAMVTCQPERIHELQGGAKAYRDLIQKIERTHIALAVAEKKNG